MPRRTTGFIAIFALALLVAPLATDAQPPTHVFRIGLLYASNPSPGTAEAFRQGLRDLGYVEGQNLVIEERRAERSEERLRALAAELVQLPVEVLVAQGGLYTLRAAKEATSTIPIVMVGPRIRWGRDLWRARPNRGGTSPARVRFSPTWTGSGWRSSGRPCPTPWGAPCW